MPQRRRIQALGKRPDFGAMLIALTLLIVFSVFDWSGFSRWFSIDSIVHFASILAIVAIGQTFMLIAREIDLSVGSIYGLGGIGLILLEREMGIVAAFILVLIGAAVIGYMNAALVLRGRLPAMIVTLCALFFYRGLIYLLSGGSIPSLDRGARTNWLVKFLGGDWLLFENAAFIMIIIAIVFHVVLTYTRYGNRLQAAGGDQASAESRGVDIIQVKTRAFIACSMLAAFAGMLTIADRPNTYVTMGFQYELEAIAAAVVGGCALTGGRGTIIGAVLGAFIIVSLRYELISMGAPASWYITFVGLLLIGAVLFNRFIANWIGRTRIPAE